ncbi:putative ribonuclease H-like domain-containing protein [Tanacetum coccineum]|uniref:Ribonuclease H-like domain-containing protein n=1 Tax=Tanacetum coccineum TaxID=301880 RepID=A0ABQ5A8S5_9ASTR
MDSEKEWEMLKEREAIKTLKERKLTIAELQVSDSPDEDINHSRANIHSGLLILYGEDNCMIDYDEVFAPVARIEAIRIFFAFDSYMGFILYQMDVKSAFLYGIIDEEVYMSQPPSFVDPKFPKKVYKVVKALYSLHQAPRAWYATLSTFLLKSGYRRGTIDKTLFIKKDKNDIMLMQVYVDDIIFGSTKRSWCDEFEALMKSRFQMSSMGESHLLFGCDDASTPIETQKPLTKDEKAADVDVHLYRSMIGSLMYLTASRPDIMFVVCTCSRFQVTPKTSHLNAVKRIFRYLKGKPKLGLWYHRVSSFDLEAYSDSDYAGANLDKKSITGGYQFLGRRLISWQCKKQTIVATSTTEVEYVAAANCCGQVLWIQNQMLDYGFNFMNINIYIDNESTICIVKNPIFHSKTKYIEIMHHFIRDAYEKKLIQVMKIHTDDNVVDLLTKAFDVSSLVGAAQKCLTMVLMLGLGNVGAARHKVSAARQKFVLLVTVTTVGFFALEAPRIAQDAKFIKYKECFKKKLGRKESISKQGRKNAKPRPTLDNSTFGDLDADHGMDYMDTEEPMNKGRLSKETEKLNVKTSLERMWAIKKLKESDRPKRSILTFKHFNQLTLLKTKVQSKMDASEELAARLQMEEREMYTVKERSRVFRADGSSRYIKTFTKMVSRFDRLDFIELHSLVMKRFKISTPEGINLILLAVFKGLCLRQMLQDDLWKNKRNGFFRVGNFYDNCRVHILGPPPPVLDDGTEFYMLAVEGIHYKESLERSWFID